MRRAICTAGVLTALLWFGAVPAGAVLVAEAEDSGPLPSADAGGWLEDPSRVRVFVTASSSALLEVSIDMQCSKGRRDRRVRRTLALQPAPIKRNLRLSIPRADSCHIDVLAWFEDTERAGTIRVRIRGHGRAPGY